MLPTPFQGGEPEAITIGPDAIPAVRVAPILPGGTQGPLPVFVLQHGYGADKYDLLQAAEVTAGLGFISILPDAWGHGERFDPSGPNYTSNFSADYFITVIRHNVADLVSIVATLHDDPTIDTSRIVLGGFSMGGISSIYATQRDASVGGVLAIAGGVSPDLMEAPLGMAHSGDEAAQWVASHDMAAPDNASRLAPRPVFLLHGQQDDRLPVEGSIRLYEAAKPSYTENPDRLRLKLYEATHEITMPMLADAVSWLMEFFPPAIMA